MQAATLPFVILASLLASGAAGGTGPSVPLHLEAAIGLAIQNRPELLLEIEKGKFAQSKVEEARGNFLPTLDLSASTYYVNNYDTFTGIDVTTRIGQNLITAHLEKDVPPYQMTPEVDFNLNLYSGGRDSALLAEARSNLESAHQREEGAVRRIRLEVANNYWELKKTQIQVAMAERTLDVVRLEKKVADVQRRVHRISDLDFDAVLLKNKEKEVALKTARRDRLLAFRSYLHVLGMPEDKTESAWEAIPELLDDPKTDEPVVEDAETHPDILRLKSELQAASQKEAAARAEYYPKVDLFSTYAMVGRDSDTYLGSVKDTGSEYYMIGLKVSMNLFNGFRTEERVRQAASEIRQKQLQLVQKKRELAEAECARKADLDKANDDLLLARERKKLEDARRETAKSQLKSGRISELEYRQLALAADNASDEVMLARIQAAMARNALELMVLE